MRKNSWCALLFHLNDYSTLLTILTCIFRFLYPKTKNKWNEVGKNNASTNQTHTDIMDEKKTNKQMRKKMEIRMHLNSTSMTYLIEMLRNQNEKLQTRETKDNESQVTFIYLFFFLLLFREKCIRNEEMVKRK